MRAGDAVAVTRYPRTGRPRAGDVPVTTYGTLVKSRGEQMVVEMDGQRVTVARRHVRPVSLPADVAQAVEAVFSGEVA